MSLNMNQKRRLLESIEYIDDAMISDTMSRVKTDAVTAGMTSKGKRHVIWVKQIAVLAACALLLGAIIPVISFVSKNTNPFGGFGAGANPGVEETEPKPEATEALAQTEPPVTEPEETEFVPDEHGSEGLRYIINEDGTTASFIGWGDFKGKTAYIGSVYEGLPVTKIVFYEVWEQQERLKELLLTNPDYVEQTIAPDDFTFPNIKHVVIPDSVEYVEAGVINQCDFIETLHIGAGVNKIAGSFFFNGKRGQNFRSITVSPENQHYTVKGNCLIKIETKVLLCGFADSVIPDDGSVEIIASPAFYNKPGLTSVVVPEGIVKVYGSAFLSNQGLTALSLPASLESLPLISDLLNNKALTEIRFAGTVEQWNSFDLFISTLLYGRDPVKVICSDGVVELKFDSRGDLVN